MRRADAGLFLPVRLLVCRDDDLRFDRAAAVDLGAITRFDTAQRQHRQIDGWSIEGDSECRRYAFAAQSQPLTRYDNRSSILNKP